MIEPLVTGHHGALHALICGGSGALGIALVTALLARPDVALVSASSRHATRSPQLLDQLAKHPARLRIIDADLTDRDSLHRMTVALGDAPLHLTINAAGLLHDGALMPEKNLAAINLAGLQQVFAVNAFGPILLAQAVLPRMRATPAVFASLSARVGSIGDNRLGGWYAYRAAKAAQNQLLKTLSIEARRSHPALSVQLLHPGTVDSALSRPFQRGVAPQKLFDADFAAGRLLAVIASATPANSGRFVAWDGSAVPW